MSLDLLNLALVLIVAWVSGLASSRLGYPSALGQLVGGIVLGPPILGIIEGGPELEMLAWIGMLIMALYLGMEASPTELRRGGRFAFRAAIGGFLLPFALCTWLAHAYGMGGLSSAYVGAAAGLSALAINSRVLHDLQLRDTLIAHVMLAAALITAASALTVVAVIFGVAGLVRSDALGLSFLLLKTVLFVGFLWLVWRMLGPPTRETLRRIQAWGSAAGLMLVLLGVFALAGLSEIAGLHAVVGAYVAGVVIGHRAVGAGISREVMQLVRDVSVGFFGPVFFVVAGFSVSLLAVMSNPGFMIGLFALASAGKVLGSFLPSMTTRSGWREALVVGAGMNGRGAVTVVIVYAGLSSGLITPEASSALILLAILTTAFVPVTLSTGAAWLRRRNELQTPETDRQGVIIIGAGPTARALGCILARSHPVWVVDRNREHCTFAEADGLNVVRGNALDDEVLSRAGAAHARYLIAVTPNAEVNSLAAQIARSLFLIPDVCVVDVGDEAGGADAAEHRDVSTAFGGPVVLSEWDYRIEHDRIERMGLPMKRELSASDLYKSLQKHRSSLPLAIRRGETYLPYHGRSALEQGDRVILLQFSDIRIESFDRFDRIAADCPVMDLDQSMSLDEFFELAAISLSLRVSMEPDDLTKLLESRESAGSTVLLPGLAIPHAIVPGEHKFDMLVARCRDGIEIPGQSERVHAVFVLVGSEDERNFHLKAVSAIAQLVQHSEFDKAWLIAPDAEALRKLILHGPRRRLLAVEN